MYRSFIHLLHSSSSSSPSHLTFFLLHTAPHSTPLHHTTPPQQNLLPPSSFNRNQPNKNKNKNKNNAHLLDPPHGSKTSSRSHFDCQTRRRSFGREVARTFSWYVSSTHLILRSVSLVYSVHSFIHVIGGKIISVDRYCYRSG